MNLSVMGGIVAALVLFVAIGCHKAVRIMFNNYLCAKYGHKPIPEVLTGPLGVVSCLRCVRCKICLPLEKPT